jgi:hypothetical protein
MSDPDKPGPDGIRESERRLFTHGAARVAGAPEPQPTDKVRFFEIEPARSRNTIWETAPAGGHFLIPKPKRAAAHQCPLPAQWTAGALWRCPAGHLWVVDEACACHGDLNKHGGRGQHTHGLAWRPATWWQRRTYGPGMKRADLNMAGRGMREQNALKLKSSPPKGPSGVSISPDGRR